MSREVRTVNHNYMNLNCHEKRKKCIVNVHRDQLLISSVDVDMLLKAYSTMELDSKEFTIMDYEQYLNLGDAFFSTEHHSETILVPNLV